MTRECGDIIGTCHVWQAAIVYNGDMEPECDMCGPLTDAYAAAMEAAWAAARDHDTERWLGFMAEAIEHSGVLTDVTGADPYGATDASEALHDMLLYLTDPIRADMPGARYERAMKRTAQALAARGRQQQAREEKWARERAATAPEASRPLPPQVMDTFDPLEMPRTHSARVNTPAFDQPITEEVPQ